VERLCTLEDSPDAAIVRTLVLAQNGALCIREEERLGLFGTPRATKVRSMKRIGYLHGTVYTKLETRSGLWRLGDAFSIPIALFLALKKLGVTKTIVDFDGWLYEAEIDAWCTLGETHYFKGSTEPKYYLPRRFFKKRRSDV